MSRASVSASPRCLGQLICDFEARQEAAEHADWELGDHAAAALRSRAQRDIPKDEQSFPAHAFKAPLYVSALETLADALATQSRLRNSGSKRRSAR